MHIPCLQKPRSYHGQSFFLVSGSTWRNGHSLLPHWPVTIWIRPKHDCRDGISEYPIITNYQYSITLLTESNEEIAFWHFRHVVLMQEFAVISLFTKTSQPMFTYNWSISSNMPKRTLGSNITYTLQMKRANTWTRFCKQRMGKICRPTVW